MIDRTGLIAELQTSQIFSVKILFAVCWRLYFTTLPAFSRECVCAARCACVRGGRWPCYQAEARGRVTQRSSAVRRGSRDLLAPPARLVALCSLPARFQVQISNWTPVLFCFSVMSSTELRRWTSLGSRCVDRLKKNLFRFSVVLSRVDQLYTLPVCCVCFVLLFYTITTHSFLQINIF